MSFNSLLEQAAADHSEAPETLADTLRKHAPSLTDPDMELLVGGLREQRSRWNTTQQQGSRERVTSAKVTTKPARTLAVPTLAATKRKQII
jgi:hypothetical protein